LYLLFKLLHPLVGYTLLLLMDIHRPDSFAISSFSSCNSLNLKFEVLIGSVYFAKHKRRSCESI